MNKSVIFFLIILGAILLTIIFIGAVKIKSMSDNVVKLSYMVLDKDSEIANIDNYMRQNIELLDIDSDVLLNFFSKTIMDIDAENNDYVILFPRNGCSSCVSMLCSILGDLGIDKDAVHIITESEHVTMRAELKGTGHANYYSNQMIFENIPESENITFVAFENGKCKIIKFDIEFPEYVKLFLGYD